MNGVPNFEDKSEMIKPDMKLWNSTFWTHMTFVPPMTKSICESYDIQCKHLDCTRWLCIPWKIGIHDHSYEPSGYSMVQYCKFDIADGKELIDKYAD